MAGDVMAMTGGKTLTIFLAADLKKFNTGVNQAQGGLTGLAGSMKNMLGPAAIGAGIALAGLATAMAVDGVQAAIEDEAALSKLATTLNNVGVAHDQPMIEEFISSLERSTGIADDQLRPAYDRLIRSIGDTAKTNDMLKLSMDIAAGTGATLETVTNTLGRAFDGNAMSLSKLKTGIDTAVFATGDMDLITQTLASTFSGQGATSANTFQGQIGRVSLAADNLKEAFGKGFLSAFANSLQSTNDMVDGMANLETSMQTSGKIVGDILLQASKDALELSKALGFLSNPGATWNYIFEDIAIDLRGMSKEEKIAARELNNLTYAAEMTGQTLEQTGIDANAAAGNFNGLSFRVNQSTAAYVAYINANSAARGAVQDANRDYQDLAARLKVVNTFTGEYTLNTIGANTATGAASVEVEKLTKREKELAKAHEDKSEALSTSRTELNFYTAELQKANDAIDNFKTSMQATLMQGVNLGAAFEGQFNDAGEASGQSLLAGFNKQIAEAEYFGNVLTAIKNQNADSRLIDQIASLGPIAGAKLAQQMLDEGLVPELNAKFIAVQETTAKLAEGLVPEFMIAGQNSALAMIDQISETMAKEVTQLAKIGRKIAKPLGQSFKAQLMSDVAAALAEIEATGTAARAEKVAQAERQQINLTNAAVAQALQNLVRGADARNGAPIAPVLS